MKLLHITFWHVKDEDVDRESSPIIFDPIKGIMKIHSICATNKNNLFQLLVKDLACFCEFCLDGWWIEYQNVKWTWKWVPKQLQPHDMQHVRKAMYEGWDK
jgi:hypothetical protein